MKIRIKSEGQNIRLRIPTNLIFSDLIARLGARYGLRYAGASMNQIPPEAIQALFAEFRRVKKAHGSWELVEVISADGREQVNITL